MKAIIPVAGRGTRIYPLGITTPKCMLRVLNKPILEWTIEGLWQNQVTEIILVIRPDEFGEQIRRYVSEIDYPGIDFHFAVQKQPLGTAHVLQMTNDYFDRDEEFIFLNGDDLYSPESIKKLVDSERLALLAKREENSAVYNPILTDKTGNLIRIVEKAKKDYGNLLNIGGYRLNARAFELFQQIKKSPRGEYEITDTLELLSKENPIKVICQGESEYWLPVGYPWDILKANEVLMRTVETKVKGSIPESVTKNNSKLIILENSRIHDQVQINGNLVVGRNSNIDSGVTIEGNVVIGDNCTIAFNSILRDVTVGNSCQIIESEISSSVIDDDVRFNKSVVVDNYPKMKKYDPNFSKMGNVKTYVKGDEKDTGRVEFGCVVGCSSVIEAECVIGPGVKIWPEVTVSSGQILTSDIDSK
ncbi:hypothetical protein GF357_03335 [Candidatus Dojkabacteria bacterium]|nr:hypothetical protein [Candidatus Dojkabacteria bacterium]